MSRTLTAIAALFLIVGAGAAAEPVVLEQVVSRHDPHFNVASSRLAVGRDGNVYLANGGAGGGYVLRVSPDGKERAGGGVGYSTQAVAVNADGIVATAEAHFSHRAAFWDKNFREMGHVPDFLVSDAVQWNAPSDVVAGPSGDFYGIDQHRLRVLRVAAPNKLAEAYSLDQTGEKSNGATIGLRVDESRKRFITAWRSGTIWATGFDGKPHWSVKAKPAGEPPGGFDLDADGKLYVLVGGNDVKIFDADGKPAGEIKLKVDPARQKHPIHDIRVLGGEIIVKRSDLTALFEAYSRATGELVRRITADVEVLSVKYPSTVWTAGEPLSFAINFDAGPRLTKPHFRAWMRPLGVPEFTEMTVKDGTITPPKEFAGLYQVRVTPDIGGRVAEYVVDGFVEVRTPGARGSVSIFTPLNRFYYGLGEAIPVNVVVREGKKAPSPPAPLPKGEGSKITLKLHDSRGIVWEQALELKDGKAQHTLPGKVTEGLAPGRYVFDAEVPDFTVAPQHIEVGPGLRTRPTFHIIQHGDYSLGFPAGPRSHNDLPRLVDSPDVVADHLARARKLGQNLFVDRLGNGVGLGLLGEIARDDALVERLKGDPLAIAPEKAQFEGVARRTIAGYGAYGIEEQGILLYMDAGLPIGTLWDSRKPEQMDKDLRQATQALAPYPAFRGWSWAANWWLEKHGADAAANPAEKAEYQAALKKAKETGAWSPVLDTVSDRTFSHAVEAEKRFRAIVDGIAPGKLSVMTGPYRAIQTHPPIIFGHADEVDLQYQAEQIQPPQVTPHNVDFYKRPGKPAWGHPELWNDDGTGGMIYPTLLQMVMRGANGVGQSGPVGPWAANDPSQSDPRSAAAGTTSAFRTIYELLRMYGPWLASLENADRVAIVVSTRMARIETWDGKIGSSYFDSLFEAYSACMYAHRPASFVFVEDLKPDTLARYQAVLVVDQRVELDPALAAALRQAQAKGVKVFHDGTCRAELVKDFTPLGVSFDRVKQDPSAWQDDAAYYRFPKYFKAHAETLRKVLGPAVRPVAECDNPEVMLTEKRSGDGRFVIAVNNTMLGFEPGQMWRMSLGMTHRAPVVEKLKLDVPEGWVVYDVLTRKKVRDPAKADCDFRSDPVQIFAMLPQAPKSIDIAVDFPVDDNPRWTLRSVIGENGRPMNVSWPIAINVRSRRNLSDVYHSEYLVLKSEVTGIVHLSGQRNNSILEVLDLITDLVVLAAPGSNPRGVAPRTIRRSLCEELHFGPHIRDIAVSPDGQRAVITNFNRNEDLIELLVGPDKSSSVVDRGRKIGHGFAFHTQAMDQGYTLQGFDVNTGEGYHLYTFDEHGSLTKRFALFGLPKRATSWASGAQLQDVGINNFATAPDGSWIASAGDLGLVVWDNDGKELWAEEWWKTTRKRVQLLAVNGKMLLVMDGATAIARDSLTGKVNWSLKLADSGAIIGGVVSGDRKTIVLRSDTLGGRLFVVREGKLVNTIITPSEELSLSRDGSLIAVVVGRQLKALDSLGGLVWTFTGDDALRHPRISPDGKRIVVGSELGTLTVLNRDGVRVAEKDVGALPTTAWLRTELLVVGTWNGRLSCTDATLNRLIEIELSPSGARTFENVPTIRKTGWGNAAAVPLPLTPNLLAETKATIAAVSEPRDRRPWQNKVELLTDGKPDAPPKPWLEWTDIGMIDSGWRNKLAIEVDTFRTQLRVTGVTFVEDPAHPESWLRDMRLQLWDAVAEQWRDGPYLLSDAATHSHVFDKPIEAARFRFVSTGGGTWPVGNIRLGELVFHGEVLGCSHPDALAHRPVAVLFDEKEGDLNALKYPGRPFGFHYGGAFSGGKCLELSAAGETGPAWQPPHGHAIPNWDFEIAENPKPGQYRYLQFAWKASSDKTTGMALLLGREWPGGGVAVISGDAAWKPWKEGVIVEQRVDGKLSTEWTTVRVDLWAITKGKPPRIRALSLASAGGGALFDQIVLGRTPADLDGLKPAK